MKKRTFIRQTKVRFYLAEGVKRKLNSDSPTLDDLELVEFNPPKQLSNRLYPFDNAGASLTKVEH